MNKPFYEKKSSLILSLLLPAAGVLLIAGGFFFRWYSFYLKVDKRIRGGFTLWEVTQNSFQAFKREFTWGQLLPPFLILFTILIVLYFAYLFLRAKYDYHLAFPDKIYSNFRIVSYILSVLYILLMGYLFMVRDYEKRAKSILSHQLMLWLILFYGLALLWMLLIAMRPLLPKKSAFLNSTVDRFRVASRVVPIAVLLAFWQLVKRAPLYKVKMNDMLELKISWQETIKRYREAGVGKGMKCSLHHGIGFWMFFLGMVLFVFGLCYKYVVDTLNEDRVAEEERAAKMAAEALRMVEEKKPQDDRSLAGLSGEETEEEIRERADELLQDLLKNEAASAGNETKAEE